MRIFYGLDSLPGHAAVHFPERLSGVEVGSHPLRLNSHPLPPQAMPPDGAADHPARMERIGAWLFDSCGNYAPLLRGFIASYLRLVQGQIESHRSELADSLARFDGLYAVEDWTWSALRPLPRAWFHAEDRFHRADIGFWDGRGGIAFFIGGAPSGALERAGVRCLRLNTLLPGEDTAKAFSEAEFPESMRTFWSGQQLPTSPFRLPVPEPA